MGRSMVGTRMVAGLAVAGMLAACAVLPVVAADVAWAQGTDTARVATDAVASPATDGDKAAEAVGETEGATEITGEQDGATGNGVTDGEPAVSPSSGDVAVRVTEIVAGILKLACAMFAMMYVLRVVLTYVDRVILGCDDQLKPVLYLYPTEERDVSVRLARPELITVSYPAYGDGWDVTASPDGTLTDRRTGRSLYALYYEAKIDGLETATDEGFLVRRDDLVAFLEEKLGRLGLTEREAEEMIVYWLPRMLPYRMCYIRFSLTDREQLLNAVLIEPKPDHLIRIRMVWYGIDSLMLMPHVREQTLPRIERKSLGGFVAAEWGGTELRRSFLTGDNGC